MLISTFYVLFLGILVLSLIMVHQWQQRGLRQIPGPFLAKFSNLWRLCDMYMNRHELTLQKLHQKYGIVARIGPNVVSVSDPEAIEGIYGFKNELVKSDFFTVMERYKNGKKIPTLTTLKDRKAHHAFKKPVVKAYSMTSLVGFEPYLDEMIRYLIQQLNWRFIDGSEEKTASCDIDNWFQYYSYDVISLLSLGKPLGLMESGCDEKGFLREVAYESAYISLVGQMPTLDLFLRKNPLLTRVVNITSQFAIRVRKLLLERLSAEKTSAHIDRRDFISYLQEYQQNHPKDLSELDIFGHLATNLAVGADTVSIALRAVVYFAVKNPGTIARLQEELDMANVDYPVSWQSSLGHGLPFLDAVIKESLRLHPPPSITSERVVGQQGLQLSDGRELPCGTIVGINGWVLQRSSDVFGSEVDKFKPDRWLKQEEEGEDHYQSRLQKMQHASLSFGFGPRACIGKPIALLQLHKVLPTLFGLFDIELADPAKEWKVYSRGTAKQTNMNIRLKWRGKLKDERLSGL